MCKKKTPFTLPETANFLLPVFFFSPPFEIQYEQNWPGGAEPDNFANGGRIRSIIAKVGWDLRLKSFYGFMEPVKVFDRFLCTV